MTPVKTYIDPAPEWQLNYVNKHSRIHELHKPALVVNMDFAVSKHAAAAMENLIKINPNYKMTAIVAVATTLTETFFIFLNSLSFIFQFIPDEPRIHLVKCL